MSHYNKNGFTIIELMLAMGFVASLLLAIAMTVIQIGNIYNRGITYNDVNQAGSALAVELQRSINSSSPFDVNLKNADGTANTNSMYKPTSWGGRLCTGQYSYVWNYGKAILDPLGGLNRYIASADSIHFVKVIDTGKDLCSSPSSGVIKTSAIELLSQGQNNLAIHSFSITSSAYDEKTGQRLYNISFTLGTNEQSALNGDNTKCLLENEFKSNPSYCAINDFSIVARAGNIASVAE